MKKMARSVSGVYPHLAMFNLEGECGTGAVVNWAGRLWVITYGPHLPFGSSDKLYEIGADLTQTVRSESVGGTPANRMVHRESNQLLIGPYVIDGQGKVRVIPPKAMPGRLTGTARHLTDPANRVYYATMEEGLYEVDVRTLAVTGLIQDGNKPKPGQVAMERPASVSSKLPGYHGKGLYSGQGRVIYANNGEQSDAALKDPTIASGALGEWRGSGDWRLVRRNQFTEVTGPGGIYGSENPGSDPVWTVGWDARSLILMVLEQGKWYSYRLPKGSHCYDGAHGWNTEWPRIREIGERDLLMTMHGTFWRFPKMFRPGSSAGILPRSTYLKVIGDFTRWGERVVFGCDDTAKSEFLNKRKAKGNLAGPGQSQSNLWFVEPSRLDRLGPVLGRGAVWLEEAVNAGEPSDAFLFSGYAYRGLHLAQGESSAVEVILEVDRSGNGRWEPLKKVTVPARGASWVAFEGRETGNWVRLRTNRSVKTMTAVFHYRSEDRRPKEGAVLFDGLARPGQVGAGEALLYARGGGFQTLRAATETGLYDLDAELNLRRVEDPAGAAWMRQNVAIPERVLTVDAASVVYTDERGQRWRLPKGEAAFDRGGRSRVCREVCTERDLFNCHGTFYELPADNAGGFAKVRPIATHNRAIFDYVSYRGMLVMSGLRGGVSAGENVVRSEDGKVALWVGVVDDLWQLGQVRGMGGPWKETRVRAGVPSDPYLMTGYDQKRLLLSHDGRQARTFRVEVDITGGGKWVEYLRVKVEPGRGWEHRFPEAFGAYWVRLVAEEDGVATGMLVYE